MLQIYKEAHTLLVLSWRPSYLLYPTKVKNCECLGLQAQHLSVWVLYTLTPKKLIDLTLTYVLNEFLTADRSCATKQFWKKLLQKSLAHIFTLLLTPFVSKLVNYSRCSETLNFRKNSKSTSFSFENSDFTVFKHFLKTHCSSKNWLIWTQKVPKEA